jgi:hypothetical protein
VSGARMRDTTNNAEANAKYFFIVYCVSISVTQTDCIFDSFKPA